MSVSVLMYELFPESFLKILPDPQLFNHWLTKKDQSFDGNSDCLTFLLKKHLPIKHENLINEIFNPSKSIERSKDAIIDDLVADKKRDSDYDSIQYLSRETVVSIRDLLYSIDGAVFLEDYNSEELNFNKVHPEIWKSDDNPNHAFNKAHFEEGFDDLKTFFNETANNKSYIVVFNL